MDLLEALGPRAELFFRTLAGQAAQARCEQCGTVEWVVPLDGEVGPEFFANYLCDECEQTQLGPAKASEPG